MYLQPRLVDHEPSLPSRSFLYSARNLVQPSHSRSHTGISTEYLDMPSLVPRSGIFASHDVAAAPTLGPLTDFNLQASRHGESGSIPTYFVDQKYGDRHIYSSSRHVIGHPSLNAKNFALENANSLHLYAGENMLIHYGSALDSTDNLSVYTGNNGLNRHSDLNQYGPFIDNAANLSLHTRDSGLTRYGFALGNADTLSRYSYAESGTLPLSATAYRNESALGNADTLSRYSYAESRTLPLPATAYRNESALGNADTLSRYAYAESRTLPLPATAYRNESALGNGNTLSRYAYAESRTLPLPATVYRNESALGNGDTLSRYAYAESRTLPLSATAYLNESDASTHLDRRFHDLTVPRELMFCQESLALDPRRAEMEVGHQYGFENFRSHGELHTIPSFSNYVAGSIVQSGGLLPQQPLVAPAIGEAPYRSNWHSGLPSHGGFSEGFPKTSYDAGSQERQFFSHGSPAARSSFILKNQWSQQQSFLEQMPGELFNRKRLPDEPMEGKKMKKRKMKNRDRGGRASHAIQVSLCEEPPELSVPVTPASYVQYQKQSMEERQKCSLVGASESKIDETGSEAVWNCNSIVKSSPDWKDQDSNVKASPDWNYVETRSSELVSNKNKEADATLNVQKVACFASRKFFQSLQGGDEDSDDSADLDELDDDDEYAPKDNQKLKADNSNSREERAYNFYAKLFADDNGLRKFYEEHCNCGVFECLVCFAEGSGMRRRYPDLVSLSQHAKTIMKSKKRYEHRGYYKAVSDLLGWFSSDAKIILSTPRGCVPPLEPRTRSEICSPPEVNADCGVPV